MGRPGRPRLTRWELPTAEDCSALQAPARGLLSTRGPPRFEVIRDLRRLPGVGAGEATRPPCNSNSAWRTSAANWPWSLQKTLSARNSKVHPERHNAGRLGSSWRAHPDGAWHHHGPAICTGAITTAAPVSTLGAAESKILGVLVFQTTRFLTPTKHPALPLPPTPSR